MTNCSILVMEDYIDKPDILFSILEKIARQTNECLLIANMDDTVRGWIESMNIEVSVVSKPDKDALDSISECTGAIVLSKKTGFKHDNVSLDCLGQAQRVVIDQDSTTMYNDDYDGMAIIKVGGDSKIALIENKYRIEDAINATKQAIKGGVVKGGGYALASLNFHVSLPVSIPLKIIAENMGVEFLDLYRSLEKSDDILDPVNVTIAALKNAASVAGTFLTTEVVIYSINNEDDTSN